MLVRTRAIIRDRSARLGGGKVLTALKAALAFLLVPAIFLAIILLFFPDRSRFQFDGDEGVILMTGMLVEQGHPLYASVWSDHPPLFPLMLAAGFRVVGYKVGFARMLVAVLSGLMLGGAFHFLRLQLGRVAAIAGVLLLFISPLYLERSVSVMNGLPAIAFAFFSLVLLTLWHREARRTWLVLSGAALSLSVSIKLFTGILAPLFLIGLATTAALRARSVRDWRTVVSPVSLWLVGFTVPAAIGLFWVVRPENLAQLIDIHLSVADSPEFQGEEYRIWFYLKTTLPLLSLAGIGAILAVRERRWLLLYLAGWIVLAIGFLSVLSPVWDHHLLLITVPASILAGAAIGIVVSWFSRAGGSEDKQGRLSYLKPAVILGCGILLFNIDRSAVFEHLTIFPQPEEADLQLNRQWEAVFLGIQQYAPQTTWILTDNPMMAFRNRIPVPPYIATFSRKRLAAGSLTEADLIRILEEYKPEQVFLSRFQLSGLNQALQTGYEIAGAAEGEFTWYIRSDLDD